MVSKEKWSEIIIGKIYERGVKEEPITTELSDVRNNERTLKGQEIKKDVNIQGEWERRISQI